MTVTWNGPEIWTDPGGDTYCPFCSQPLRKGEAVVDHEVWKCGELDYIELAHFTCVKAEAADRKALADWDELAPHPHIREPFVLEGDQS